MKGFGLAVVPIAAVMIGFYIGAYVAEPPPTRKDDGQCSCAVDQEQEAKLLYEKKR